MDSRGILGWEKVDKLARALAKLRGGGGGGGGGGWLLVTNAQSLQRSHRGAASTPSSKGDLLSMLSQCVWKKTVLNSAASQVQEDKMGSCLSCKKEVPPRTYPAVSTNPQGRILQGWQTREVFLGGLIL